MPDLRAAGPDDWPAWRRLRLTALEESPDAFGSRLADWLSAGEERWRDRLASVPFNVMAFDGEDPVGMASGTAVAGSAVELISMYVRVDLRGAGVADQLVNAVAEWARQQGADAVLLSVRTTNDRARSFYRRLGFVDVGAADTEPDEAPETVMRLALDRYRPTVLS
jgi:ribosomal protein S18 acetylase RimI-like enzyme